MKIEGKMGDIHVAAEGLSSVRIQVAGQAQPAIVNLPAAMIAPLVPLSGKEVVLEISEKAAAG